jgi:hypothetical protein
LAEAGEATAGGDGGGPGGRVMGIAILCASGVEFPIYPPPGIVILLTGAIFVGLATWPWAPGVGAFLGLFVLVGFLISPTGLSNLSGKAGTSVAVARGSRSPACSPP